MVPRLVIALPLSESTVAPNTAEVDVILEAVAPDNDGVPDGATTALPDEGVVMYIVVAPVLLNDMLFELYTPATVAVAESLILKVPLAEPSVGVIETEEL